MGFHTDSMPASEIFTSIAYSSMSDQWYSFQMKLVVSPSSLVTEQTALWILGIYVSPVGQDEGQVGHTALQESPQVLGHKLVALVGEMKSIRQVGCVVLWGRGPERNAFNSVVDKEKDSFCGYWTQWNVSTFNGGRAGWYEGNYYDNLEFSPRYRCVTIMSSCMQNHKIY